MRTLITSVVVALSVAALTGAANARNGGGGHSHYGGGGGGWAGGGSGGGGGGPKVPNYPINTSDDACLAYWNAGDLKGYNICRFGR